MSDRLLGALLITSLLGAMLASGTVDALIKQRGRFSLGQLLLVATLAAFALGAIVYAAKMLATH